MSTGPSTPDPLWDAVQRRIARPRPSRGQRLARALGTSEEHLVLLSAARDLALPWAIALGGALATVLVAGAAPAHSHAAFLLLGPAVPVLAVVAAYDATDALREVSDVTPYSKVRLALLRTLAVLSFAVPSMALVGLAVPVLGPVAWAWLLPALLLSTVAVALLGPLTARTTGAVVAGGWAVVVGAVELWRGSEVLTGTAVQATFAVLVAGVLVAGAVLHLVNSRKVLW